MSNLHYVMLIGMAAMIVLVVFLNRQPRMKHGEILPANEMKAKYNLTAENYKPPKLDPNNVPANLCDLIELAAKWGIGDDIIRDDFEQRASEGDKQELRRALTGRTAEVTRWLDSLKADRPMTAEAACFMYMLEALDEMRLWPD